MLFGEAITSEVSHDLTEPGFENISDLFIWERSKFFEITDLFESSFLLL